ncbi:unnamed protein product [Bursaphelenchus xylophilus]|nr:unnamed protein product [Bursaphelenchus xylophilus]CAG9130017.1 unnamed protein product [Bursaphelenchus xylophilus]
MSIPGVETGDEHIGEAGANLTEPERELLKEELKKTEEEINTLRQVLASRQKHAQLLKHKLGITPFAELSQELQQQLRTVRDTPVYQKTSEVVSGTAESVSNKFQDMRNSSLFKSFESKLGSAFTNAKMAASTSFDHLAGVARPQSQAGSPQKETPTSPLS